MGEMVYFVLCHGVYKIFLFKYVYVVENGKTDFKIREMMTMEHENGKILLLANA